MSRSSPFVVMLSDSERAELTRRSRCYTLPHEQVVRAKIVLLAADGVSNTAIAERVDVHVDVVSRWRERESDSASNDWTGCPIGSGRAGRGYSRRRWLSR